MAATKVPAKKAPAKKKAEIVLDPGKQALINAIATGNTDGVDLDAVKALIADMGLSLVAKGVQVVKSETRIDRQRQWLTSTELSDESRENFEKVPEVMGKTVIFTSPDEIRDVTQVEIDDMVDELTVIRPAQDDLEGRRQAIRATALEVISLRNDGDPYAEGTLVSPSRSKKVVVGKQVRKGEPNYEALKNVLPPEVWAEIVSEQVEVTYKVDEDKLVKALGEGRVSVEHFAALVPEESVSRTFTLKDLKEGDPL